MNEVSMQLEAGRRHFRPGETLGGSFSWSADVAPVTVEVRLYWFTMGAGPRQIGLVKKMVISHPAARDSRQFLFELPVGPWSFRGRLAGLSWAVEGVLLPSHASARAEFNVGPEGQMLLLSRDDTESKAEAV